jgi:putative RecB family exonuclease
VSEVYSHSRLSSFESCPKKFHFRYVLKLPVETESIEAFAGKRVHEVLERLYKSVLKGRVPSLERVLGLFRELWTQHFKPETIRIAREGVEADFYRENGERCLTNYYRGSYPFDQAETLGLEQRVAFALDASGAYRVQGVIDRVVRLRDEERTIEIHDFKTGRWVPSQAELDRDRQLALYQIGIAEQYGAEQPIRLVWHYLLKNQTRTSTRTPEALAELRTQTIELINKIRVEQEFEARPSTLCGWCEFAEICPASGRQRAEPPLSVAPPPPPPPGQLSLL